jgi:hypothetical protein
MISDLLIADLSCGLWAMSYQRPAFTNFLQAPAFGYAVSFIACWVFNFQIFISSNYLFGLTLLRCAPNPALGSL